MFWKFGILRNHLVPGTASRCFERAGPWSIEKGEFCVLLGPSGSGKSTLLNIIGGIESADGGSISIEGEKLADMKEKKLSQYRTETSWLYLSDVQPDSESDCEGEYLRLVLI